MMEYSYKGQEYTDYPKSITLHHPEIEPILCKPKGDITLDEASFLLGIPGDTMRSDCESLIKQQLARQWGKAKEQLEVDKDTNPYVINNALLFLIEHGDNSTTLSVALELLSQTDDFLAYNKLDTEWHSPIVTVIFALCNRNPEQLQDFLLRDDITATSKTVALQALTLIGSADVKERPKEEIFDSLLETVKTLLAAYLADKDAHRISNKQVLSHLIDTAACSELEPLGHQIMRLFAYDLIDEDIISEEDADAGLFNGGWVEENPPSRKVRDWLLPATKE